VISPFRNLLPTVVAPFLAYFALHLLGVADVPALSVAAVFPLAATVVGAVRNRRLDPIGALSVTVTAVGIITALLVHDPRLVLEANTLPGLLVGVAFLASAAAGRPLLAALIRHREVSASLTAIWGAALTAAGLGHAALGWWAPTEIAVGFSPVITAVAVLPALAWTLHVRRRLTGAVPAATPPVAPAR
jgi:hypothetical protein